MFEKFNNWAFFFCFENQVQAQKKTEKIPLYCLLDAKKAQICIKLSENVISSPFLFLACTWFSKQKKRSVIDFFTDFSKIPEVGQPKLAIFDLELGGLGWLLRYTSKKSWSSFFPQKNAERLDIFECFIIKLEKTKHAILYDRVKTLNPLLRIAVLSALLGFHTHSKPNRRLTSSFSNVAKVGVNKREVLLGKNL